MELAVMGAVAGLGYFLTQKRERGNSSNIVTIPANLRKNNRNIYESGDRMQNLRVQEQKRSDRNYAQFFNDVNTNMVMELPGKNLELNKTEWADEDLPLEYNGDLNKTQLFQLEKDRLEGSNNSNFGISLSGEPIKEDTFKHNNMIPFFGGSVKQNVDDRANNALMENFTGNVYNYQDKRELKPLFNPYNKDINNPYGMSNLNGYNKERYIKSIERRNEQPLEKILVGPGLNKGYTSQPTGGFQQADTRDYCLPKTVDDLRVKTKPKLTYEGRMVSGQHISIRGEIGTQCKRLPDAFYTNLDGERNLITTGEYIADAKRPKVDIKDNARMFSCEVKGGIGPNNGNKTNIRSTIQKAKKQNFCSDGVRNATLQDQWKLKGGVGHFEGGDFDYGRGSVKLRPTVREKTTECTRLGNAGLDKEGGLRNNQKAKATRNEHFVKCSRFNDNLDNTVKKSTVYDPNDKPRTTMKETNIHHSRSGDIGLASRAESSWVKDSNDIARTTMKETNIHNSYNGSLGGQERAGKAYDPEDKPRTTMKETTSLNRKNGGQVGNQTPGNAYQHAEYRASDTNRQTTSCEYTGNAEGPEEGGYTVTEVDAPETNRQHTTIEYTGNAGNGDKQTAMSYADIYNAEVKSLRETCDSSWVPGAAAPNVLMGADSINMKTTRLGEVNNKYLQERENKPNRIQHNVDKSTLGINTSMPMRSDGLDTRLDPTILDGYRNNPYTQPLPGYNSRVPRAS
jgi:hypothetical protein